MNLPEYLLQEKKLTDKYLSQYLVVKKEELNQIDSVLSELIDAITNQFLSGGKRLRPLLFRLGYQLVGGQIDEAVVKASLFVELMHSYILVHDDIADRDHKRYGQPTLEKVFTQDFLDKFGSKNPHYGLSIAMVSGDLINTLAHQVLLESGLNESQVFKLESIMTQTLHQVVGGWYLHQIQNHQDLAQVTPVRYLEGMKLVSASYTVEAPLSMGVAIGPKSQLNYESLTAYAYHVGMGFQIQDDILGVFGDSKITGKPVGNDLREGKKTLLVLDAYHQANSQQKHRLETLLGHNLTEAELHEVQEIISQTGALAKSKQSAHDHVGQAILSLENLKGDPTTTKILKELAEFMISRNY